MRPHITIPPGSTPRRCNGCHALVVDVRMIKRGRDFNRVLEIASSTATYGVVHQCQGARGAMA